MNRTDPRHHTLPPPPLPPQPPAAPDDTAPDAAPKGNLDLDDEPQINNQHLEVR